MLSLVDLLAVKAQAMRRLGHNVHPDSEIADSSSDRRTGEELVVQGRRGAGAPDGSDRQRAMRVDNLCRSRQLRWSRKMGQELKLGSLWLEDGPDDGQAEAVFG